LILLSPIERSEMDTPGRYVTRAALDHSRMVCFVDFAQSNRAKRDGHARKIRDSGRSGPQPQKPDCLFKTLFKQYIVYGLKLIFLQP